MVETIYVTTPGVSIHQDGGLLVLEQDHQVLKELPLHCEVLNISCNER